MDELIREIKLAMSIHVMSTELLPETRERVDAMLRRYGRDETLAAMRSLVEPYAADEERSRPTSGSGMADMQYIAASFKHLFLTLSIDYVESLSHAR